MHTIVVTFSLFVLLVNLREVMNPTEKMGCKVDVKWVNVNYSGDRCFITADCLQVTYYK